jgi:hypothetical protein
VTNDKVSVRSEIHQYQNRRKSDDIMVTKGKTIGKDKRKREEKRMVRDAVRIAMMNVHA